ncbi:MAG: phosphatase PAP2 family protein [Fimbriimonadia bacterium]|jgi:undecaprenyl-diphosphatase
MGGWDEVLFRWINEGWANPFFDHFMPFVTHLAKNPVGIAMLTLAWFAILIWGGSKGRRAALLVLPAVLISNELADLGKAHLGYLRPCVELPGVRVLGESLTSGGMPSAHAANMASVAAVLIAHLGRAWWPVWLLPFVSGLSRVYIGVHYPSQVAVGWLLGTAVGLAIAWPFRVREKEPAPVQTNIHSRETKEGKGDDLSEMP